MANQSRKHSLIRLVNLKRTFHTNAAIQKSSSNIKHKKFVVLISQKQISSMNVNHSPLETSGSSKNIDSLNNTFTSEIDDILSSEPQNLRTSEQQYIRNDINNSNDGKRDWNNIKISKSKVQKSDASTQTEFLYKTVNMNPSFVSCWQDKSLNEASTQISIYSSDTNRIKPSMKTCSCFQQKTHKSSNDLPFSIVDIKEDSIMKQFGGVTMFYFSRLLNFIQLNFNDRFNNRRKLSIENRLLLFLMKFKLGLSFSALGCFFRISHACASSIFYSILNILVKTSELSVEWPEKNTVSKNGSPIFQNYPNCIAVIDFVELKFFISPHVDKKALIHINYSGYFKVKYLIAITPNRAVSFVSKCYDYIASNSYIVEDSGFLNKLKSGDTIITTKNLSEIKHQFDQRQCTLIKIDDNDVASKETEKHQLIKTYTNNILQKLQMYQIFSNLGHELFPHIDKIVTTAIILINGTNE